MLNFKTSSVYTHLLKRKEMLIVNGCITVLRTLILPYVGDDELLAKLGAGTYCIDKKLRMCKPRKYS